jgi:ATP-dependent DNA helicase RecG
MVKDVAVRAPDSKSRRPGRPTPIDPLTAWLAPARALRSVGPRLEGALVRLFGLPDGVGPRRLDLLWHLPSAVIDRRLRDGYAGANEGERVTLEVLVQQHRPAPRSRYRPGAASRHPYRVRCLTPREAATADGALDLVFFHARPGYLQEVLPEGSTRVVSGPLTRYGGGWQIVHPELILTPAAFAASSPMQPVYPLIEGLRTRALGRLIRQALDDLPELPEWQDKAWLERWRWPSFKAALQSLHQPVRAADVALDAPARRRLAFDELLANQLALALVRQSVAAQPGRALAGDGGLCRALLDALPFRLTGGQREVLATIRRDMARPTRMLRLLQGDVGSGKTLVAVLAMLNAVEAGGQAAIMAPTEVLARQHQTTLAKLLAPAGLQPTLLTGRERGAERARRRADLAGGRSRIVVGTHALFQTDVAFADLALAVIDEQHRFGVHQRLGLAAKGQSPDLLVMTATPIPRTLVLALYGDMAVSELREKPRGRKAIRTRVMPLARLDRVLAGARAGGGRPPPRRPPRGAIGRSGPRSGRSSGWCTAACRARPRTESWPALPPATSASWSRPP